MENIKTYLRIRPSTDKEKSTNPTVTFKIVSEHDLIVQSNAATNAPESKYEFDHIFNENVEQTEIHNAIAIPIVLDVVKGYNCTLYSYGTNGTSEYYTIGQADLLSRRTSENRISPKTLSSMNDSCDVGLIPLTIVTLFRNLNAMATSYTVRVSYLEIFNDEIIDLLQDNDTSIGSSTIKIFENSKNQVILSGIKELGCTNHSMALEALRLGQEKLKDRLHSASSHKIFTINVQLKEKSRNADDDDNDLLKLSRLNFVELSSMENSKIRAKSVQSLASFNRVIQALIDKQNHIPYRDSKMTRILQESLGGNAKTSFFATIAPESAAVEESLQTLDLMVRIRCVLNQPRINERFNKNVKLNDVAYEITQLKRDIEATKNQDGIQMSIDTLEEQRNLLNQSRLDLRRNRCEMQTLSEELENLENNYTNTDENLSILSRKIALLQKMKDVQNNHLRAINLANQQRDECIIKQIEAEAKLTEQCNQLVETIDIQKEDATKLHDSIERRKMVETDLESTFTRFRSDLDSQLNHLSSYLVNNNKIIQNMILVHKNNLEKFHNMTVSVLELLKSNTMLLDEKAHVTMQNGHKNIDTQFNDILDDFTGRTLIAKDFAPPSVSPFEEFVSICERHFEMFMKARKTFMLMLDNRSQITDKLISNLKGSIESFSDELLNKIQHHRLNLDKYANEQETILQKFAEAHMLYQKKIEQIFKNTENFKSLNPFSMDIYEIAEKSTKNCLEMIFKLKSNASTENDRMIVAPRNDLANDCKKTMSSILKLVMENINQEANAEQIANENHIIASKTASSQLNEMESCILEKSTVLTNNNLTFDVLNDFEAGNRKNSTEHDENSNLIQNMLMAQEQLTKSLSNGIDSCNKDVKFFCNINFSQYPNGETPIKKDYKTSVTLAATTPHDELKRKFRERFDQLSADDLNEDISFLRK